MMSRLQRKWPDLPHPVPAKANTQAWRVGLVVRSTAGLAPRFESQYPYGGTHLLGHQASEWCESLTRKK